MTNENELKRFHTAYDEYGQMVYQICLNYLKSKADSEDAVQEVFLRFIEKTEMSMSEPHQKFWLIRTAINYCKDQKKSFWKKDVMLVDFNVDQFHSFNNPGDKSLLSLLLELPDNQRICLYLYYVQGFSVQEISKGLRLTQSNVKIRLKRGREALRLKKGEL